MSITCSQCLFIVLMYVTVTPALLKSIMSRNVDSNTNSNRNGNGNFIDPNISFDKIKIIKYKLNGNENNDNNIAGNVNISDDNSDDKNMKNSNGSTSTTLIRERLNFNNEIIWKKFCEERLNLINRFKLYNFKPMENLKLIKKIAKLLRIDFHFSNNFQSDFEKLVIFSIQSIRRNNIRKQKKVINGKALDNKKIGEETIDIKGGKYNNFDNLIRDIIKDINENVIPLNKQKLSDSTSEGPNLSIFTSEFNNSNIDTFINPNNNVHDGNSNNNNTEDISLKIPFFLKEKILLNIHKSKTCFEISQNSINDLFPFYNNVKSLGSLSIHTSISFIIERFFSSKISNDSIEYIIDKINSDDELVNLAIELFNSSTFVNLEKINNNAMKVDLIKLALGALVKDFGFDPILYELGEIFYHIVITKYSIHLISSSKIMINGSVIDKKPDNNIGMHEKSTILSTLSIKPNIANKELTKKVKIKFNNKEQDFNFPILSNSTPTILEIVENCKKLFNISDNNRFILGVYYNNDFINDDSKLEKLFNDFSINLLNLELKKIT